MNVWTVYAAMGEIREKVSPVLAPPVTVPIEVLPILESNDIVRDYKVTMPP